MARPHIDYLQSQTLPWQPSASAQRRGCQIKSLSLDPDSGAASLVVRFPSGWTAAAADCLGTTEELFVLEGMLELDGRRYGPDCYGWFPAGWRHTVCAAPDGAVALLFYGPEPAATAGGPVPDAPGEQRCVDAFELSWAEDGSCRVFGGAGQRCKVLHGAPERGPATMLITSPAHLRPPGWRAPQEIHPCAEELFVLAGDLLSHAGAMTAGAYVWRPAGVAHGPYGSRGGHLALLRTHGAGLATDYTAHEITLQRAPDYQPVLPPGLRGLTTHPWRAQRY